MLMALSLRVSDNALVKRILYLTFIFIVDSDVNESTPDASFRLSDIVQPGLFSDNLAVVPLCAAWVNGTALAPLCPPDVPSHPQAAPTSPYPFKRLATTSAPNSTIFYIYHQLDDMTFAEDEWSQLNGGWTTSNISISTGYFALEGTSSALGR